LSLDGGMSLRGLAGEGRILDMVPGAHARMALSFLHLRRMLHSLRAWQVLLAMIGFALPFALLPLLQAQSAMVHWERVSTYPGDQVVRRVVVGRSAQMRALYAVGANSGIHLSVDDGKQWSQISGDLPEVGLNQIRVVDLAVNADDASLAYVVAESSPPVPRPMVFWTADMGLAWQPRASLGQERVRAIALDPLSGDPYVVTTHDVLRGFVFEDSSKKLSPRERFTRGVDDLHWLSIGSFEAGTQATSLAIGSHTAITLPASSSLTDLERANKRPIIKRTSPNQQGQLETLVLYVGTRGGGLEIIADSPVAGPYPILAQEDADTLHVRQRATVRAVCVDPYQPTRVYVATEQGLYVTQDAGVSWRALSGPWSDQGILSLLADPLISGTLYVGLAGGGVFFSADAGATWQPLGSGLGRASVFSLALSSPEPRVLYAGTDSGLWSLPMPMAEGRPQGGGNE